MPIYEYKCKNCNNQFEALVLGRERSRCPKCRGLRLEQLLSAFSTLSTSQRKESGLDSSTACGSCGDPAGPGSCSMN